MKNVQQSEITAALLQTFLAVFEEGSVAAAAARLDENPSTLSHRISRLEDLLTQPLFVRSGRGIIPTSFAEDLVEDAQAAVAKIQAIAERRLYASDDIDTEFSIATTDIERSVLLLDAFNVIRERSPKLRIRYLWENYADITALRRMGVDFIVSPIITDVDPDIRSHLLFRDQSVCYYDASMRGPPDTLEKYLASQHVRVIFSENDISLTDVALSRIGVSRQIAVTMPSVSELPKLILGTELSVTMPSRLQGTLFQQLASCPTPFPFPVMNFNLFWHERSDSSPRHRWLREALFEIVKKRPELKTTG